LNQSARRPKEKLCSIDGILHHHPISPVKMAIRK
jgi:hypothetical protein